MILSMGIAVLSTAPIEYSVSGKDYDLTKTMYGIDASCIAGTSYSNSSLPACRCFINEKIKVDTPSGTYTDEKALIHIILD